jgi:hypothetical protein
MKVAKMRFYPSKEFVPLNQARNVFKKHIEAENIRQSHFLQALNQQGKSHSNDMCR